MDILQLNITQSVSCYARYTTFKPFSIVLRICHLYNRDRPSNRSYVTFSLYGEGKSVYEAAVFLSISEINFRIKILRSVKVADSHDDYCLYIIVEMSDYVPRIRHLHYRRQGNFIYAVRLLPRKRDR